MGKGLTGKLSYQVTGLVSVKINVETSFENSKHINAKFRLSEN